MYAAVPGIVPAIDIAGLIIVGELVASAPLKGRPTLTPFVGRRFSGAEGLRETELEDHLPDHRRSA